MLATKACLSLLISPSARTWSSRFSKNFNFSFLSLFQSAICQFLARVLLSSRQLLPSAERQKPFVSQTTHRSGKVATMTNADSFNDLSQPTRRGHLHYLCKYPQWIHLEYRYPRRQRWWWCGWWLRRLLFPLLTRMIKQTILILLSCPPTFFRLLSYFDPGRKQWRNSSISPLQHPNQL